MQSNQLRYGSFRGLLASWLLVAGLTLASCVHPGAPAWNEFKLFCGMSFPGGEVTEADWRLFCDEQVTPAFPDGYTSVEATGYWKGTATATARENSRVLLIVAPPTRRTRCFPSPENTASSSIRRPCWS